VRRGCAARCEADTGATHFTVFFGSVRRYLPSLDSVRPRSLNRCNELTVLVRLLPIAAARSPMLAPGETFIASWSRSSALSRFANRRSTPAGRFAPLPPSWSFGASRHPRDPLQDVGMVSGDDERRGKGGDGVGPEDRSEG
jgi:hypothetical protein